MALNLSSQRLSGFRTIDAEKIILQFNFTFNFHLNWTYIKRGKYIKMLIPSERTLKSVYFIRAHVDNRIVDNMKYTT